MSRADGQLKIAVLISGRGSNMQAIANHAGGHCTGYKICLVAANKPAEGLSVASEAGLPTTLIDHKKYNSKKEHEDALAEAIEASGASWICLAGYMAVLSADFITRFEGKIINIPRDEDVEGARAGAAGGRARAEAGEARGRRLDHGLVL